MPVIIATWAFGEEAVRVGWQILAAGGSALDAVERGANAVEENPAVHSVGYGGLPNSEGVVELDAAIMDGRTHAAGAVAGITRIRRPVSVARRVMERTPHVMLVGNNARRFALQQGFPDENLATPETRKRHLRWRLERSAPDAAHFEDQSHDTVAVLALDAAGDLAAACTTSGLAWKVPGRVGDSPIVGAGLYADNAAGAAAATGNGDEILKAALSARIVLRMEGGMPPQEACEEAIGYLLRKRPEHQGRGAAVIALSRDGRLGQAATRDGFQPPDRRWLYAWTRDGIPTVEEGRYLG